MLSQLTKISMSSTFYFNLFSCFIFTKDASYHRITLYQDILDSVDDDVPDFVKNFIVVYGKLDDNSKLALKSFAKYMLIRTKKEIRKPTNLFKMRATGLEPARSPTRT